MHLDERNKHRLDIPRAGMRCDPHQFDIFISHYVGESLANEFVMMIFYFIFPAIYIFYWKIVKMGILWSKNFELRG